MRETLMIICVIAMMAFSYRKSLHMRELRADIAHKDSLYLECNKQHVYYMDSVSKFIQQAQRIADYYFQKEYDVYYELQTLRDSIQSVKKKK